MNQTLTAAADILSVLLQHESDMGSIEPMSLSHFGIDQF